jgi:hypothetical protein
VPGQKQKHERVKKVYVIVSVIKGTPDIYFETSKKRALAHAEELAKKASIVIVEYSLGVPGKGERMREWDMRKAPRGGL